MQRARINKGFTIVELIIVVVVVAILVGVVVVAYGGVTQRAKETAAQNDIDNARRALALYAAEHGGSFPATLEALDLKNSEDVAYRYYVNNTTIPKGYCVTAVADGGSVRYYAASNFTYVISTVETIHQTTPTKGACPGHDGLAETISNDLPNPSAEVNITGYGQPNGSTVVRNLDRAHSGSASVLVTMPPASSGNVGITIINTTVGGGVLKPSTTYTYSAYVYVPTGTVNLRLAVQGSGRTGATSNPERTTAVKNAWVRMHQTFTTLGSGSVQLYVLNDASFANTTRQFWVDSFMLTEGTAPYTYADGNSLGWTWSGASGNSASSGPVLPSQ